MNCRYFLRLLFLLLTGSQIPVPAQQVIDTSMLMNGYISSYWIDTKELLLFPKHVQKRDFWFIAGGVALTGSGFIFDETLENELRIGNWRKDYPMDVLKYGLEPWGSGLYPALLAAGVYTVGALNHRSDLQYIGMFQVKTLLLSMAASRVPKFLIQRHRPGEQIDAYEFEGPFAGFSGNYSMPSGHSFISFSWAAATASCFEGKKGLKIALYTLASAVSVSRIYKGEHWLSDVTAGAVLGFAFGKLSWRIQSLYDKGSFRKTKQ